MQEEQEEMIQEENKNEQAFRQYWEAVKGKKQ